MYRGLERELQTCGSTNFVLLIESIVRGYENDDRLMDRIPPSNNGVSKRIIVSTAKKIYQYGDSRTALELIVSSNNVHAHIINTAIVILKYNGGI